MNESCFINKVWRSLSLARYLYNLSAVRQTLISINQAPLFLTYIIIFNGARLWVTPIKQAHYNCYFLVSGGQSIVDLVPGNNQKRPGADNKTNGWHVHALFGLICISPRSVCLPVSNTHIHIHMQKRGGRSRARYDKFQR
jgi:hypothetical protein